MGLLRRSHFLHPTSGVVLFLTKLISDLSHPDWIKVLSQKTQLRILWDHFAGSFDPFRHSDHLPDAILAIVNIVGQRCAGPPGLVAYG